MTTFGTPRRHVAQCGSTNDLARAWARDLDDPAPSGALVTADFQTRGRGQRGRQWQAGWGQSALMSFVYHPSTEVEVSQLGLVVALAVADALASLADLPPRLKWPNDILLDGRKVAGILVEIAPQDVVKGPTPRQVATLPKREGEEVEAQGLTPRPPVSGGSLQSNLLRRKEVGSFAILGIGVNVNQERFVGSEKFVYPPTSLRLVTGETLEVETVVSAVCASLANWEDRWRREGFLSTWMECQRRLAIGATVRQGEKRAELVGLNWDGSALVRMADGTFAHWSTVD